MAVGDRPEGHIKKALVRVLRPVLSREQSSTWAWLKLAVRNAARPSRILRCIFKIQSVAEPARTLTIEVEVNVSERKPRFELQHLPFSFGFRGDTHRANLVSFNINEMLATKMRAMFQRKKGRDLFDLYWALTAQSALPVNTEEVLMAFRHYMQEEGTQVPRHEFLSHLDNCLADKVGFCNYMNALLKQSLDYSPTQAAAVATERLLSRLPE